MRYLFAAPRYGFGGIFLATSLSLVLPLAVLASAASPVAGQVAPAPQNAAAVPQNGSAAQPAPAASARVDARAAWDNDFVYFAFTVDDADVLATNTRPMSQPEQDDSIGVYLRVGADAPAAPDAQTKAMLVSAAGGFTFLSGEGGRLGPKPLFSVKYGVTVQGSLNRSDDRDKGYVVTIAIPLSALNLDAKTAANATIQFAGVVRARGGGLTATAPGVKAEGDLSVPQKWGTLRLAAEGATATPDGGTIIAARISDTVRPPLINGGVRDVEWPQAGTFAFASPNIAQPIAAIPIPAVPTVNTDTTAPTVALSPALAQIDRQLFARYLLGFQADLRRPFPSRNVFDKDTTVLIADQPASGVGPWFSSDRVSYHRTQLTDMRRAGIDTALVEFAGPLTNEGLMDSKALLVMVGALRELATENVPIPSVAPCVLTPSLTLPDPSVPAIAAPTPKTDLSTPAGRGALYRALQTWFRLIPPELRQRVALPQAGNANVVWAYPVFLSDGTALSGLTDASWADELRALFAEEFGATSGGTTLLFIGGDNFEANAGGLAAQIPLQKGSKGSGLVSSAVIRPGVLDATVTRRDEGATYRTEWGQLADVHPRWMVLDSWNDWARATEIAPSRQYGTRYVDLTRVLSVAANLGTSRAVRWVGGDVPRRMRPGDVATVSASVRNFGTDALRPGDGTTVAYRWYQNGKVVAESPGRVPLPGAILPTQTGRVNIGLSAGFLVAGRLEPLPPGDYTVAVDFAYPSPFDAPLRLFSDAGADGKPTDSTPLLFSVTVASDLPDSIEIASTTTPPLMVGGGTYPVSVRVRWTGKEPLQPGNASLVCQFQTEDGQTTVQTATLPLVRPLVPGQWETVRGVLRAGDPSNPLPPACPELRRAPSDPGAYRLRWVLTRNDSTVAVPGEYLEFAAVYPVDDEARVLPAAELPKQAEANATLPLEVTVVNRGARTWPKSDYRVGYHWYFPDGVEAEWNPPVTVVLPKDIGPGESIKMSLPLQMPDRDGEYILSLDVLRQTDSTWLSTRPVSRGSEAGLVPVRVMGGRLAYADLSRLFDTDGIAREDKPGDGDLDGTGASFPSESFPPDVYGIAAYFAEGEGKKDKNPPAYPSGYFREYSAAARQVSFRYGPNTNGAKNAVTCKGQTISLPHGKYSGLHLAATATGGADRPLPLTVRYRDNTTRQVTATVGDWNRAPGASDPVAAFTRRKRTANGDIAAPCALRHVIYPLDVSRDVVSVTLPDDAKVKVFAITLDK